MVNDYMLYKAFDKVKDTNTDNKLTDYIIFKNVAILIACIIKDDGKFDRKYF